MPLQPPRSYNVHTFLRLFLRRQIDLLAGGSHCNVYTAALTTGNQRQDVHTTIQHKAEDTSCLQEQRNVVSDSADCVFKGRIVIDVSVGVDLCISGISFTVCLSLRSGIHQPFVGVVVRCNEWSLRSKLLMQCCYHRRRYECANRRGAGGNVSDGARG